MSKQLSKRVGVIVRVKYLLPQKATLLLYKALIQSILIYSCQVWGHTYDSHIKKLITIQNRVTKLIISERIDSNSRLKKLKLMSIKNITQFYSNLYILRSINNMTCLICTRFFKFCDTGRSTRIISNKSLEIPKCKLNYTQNSLFFKGVKLWNTLDINLKLCKDFRNFKKVSTNFYTN